MGEEQRTIERETQNLASELKCSTVTVNALSRERKAPKSASFPPTLLVTLPQFVNVIYRGGYLYFFGTVGNVGRTFSYERARRKSEAIPGRFFGRGRGEAGRLLGLLPSKPPGNPPPRDVLDLSRAASRRARAPSPGGSLATNRNNQSTG